MRDQRIPGIRPTTRTPSNRPCSTCSSRTDPSSGPRPSWTAASTPRSATEPGHTPSTVDVEDAIEDLYAAGLLHRLGTYVFATRAAHEAHALVAVSARPRGAAQSSRRPAPSAARTRASV